MELHDSNHPTDAPCAAPDSCVREFDGPTASRAAAPAAFEPMPCAATENQWIRRDIARTFSVYVEPPAMKAKTIMIPADLPPGLVDIVSQQALLTAMRFYEARRMAKTQAA